MGNNQSYHNHRRNKKKLTPQQKRKLRTYLLSIGVPIASVATIITFISLHYRKKHRPQPTPSVPASQLSPDSSKETPPDTSDPALDLTKKLNRVNLMLPDHMYDSSKKTPAASLSTAGAVPPIRAIHGYDSDTDDDFE